MKLRKTFYVIVLLNLLLAATFTPAAASFNPPFTEVTGSGNPFNGVDVGLRSAPSFADLDGDGDLDAFIGESDGVINYYRNDGTVINPAFTLVTGSGNPFNGVDVGLRSTPSFADLDGDGDLDAFIGEVDVIVAVHRGHDLDVRIGRHAVLEAPDALLQVERPWHTGQQRNLAFLTHELDQQLSRRLATLVVVHPQVGEALTVRRVRVPGHHRDPRLHCLVDRVLTRRRIVARDADSLEDRVLQDELEGYRDYVGHMRYRLLPGVW